MRLNINLASQPYEAARSFRRQMALLVIGLALVTAALVGYITYQWLHSRGINQQIVAARGELQSLDQEEARARALLNRPQNRVVADQSEFLNELFARKALSWTRVFSEMEKIMPSNLHVVSMKPDYSKTGELTLHMVVATDSRDRAVELVRRMEKSKHFRDPQVVAEAVLGNTGDQSAGPGNIQFDIAAVYIPNAVDMPDDESGKPGEGSDQAAPKPAAPVVKSSQNRTTPSDANVQAQTRPARQRSH